MTIRLSTLATLDLQDISDYTHEVWGSEQEERYLTAIYQCFQEIQSGTAIIRLRNDLFLGAQAAAVGRHLVIFMIEEEAIFVSRILHQSMDFPRHLYPLE